MIEAIIYGALIGAALYFAALGIQALICAVFKL